MTGDHFNVPRKRCSRCKRFLPAKFPFFTRTKFQASGLRSNCRGCKYGWTNDEFQIKVLEFILLERGYKQCVTCLEPKPLENFHKKKKGAGGRTAECKQCSRTYEIRYYQDNRENFRRRHKEWREKNPEAVNEIQRRFRASLRYKEANRIQNHRYITQKRNLPFSFTIDDWKRALNYFGGACAVCGRKPDEQHTIAADHWIPLSKGGATTINNIVPLCHAKKGGRATCNNRKKNKMPDQWLKETNEDSKASEILARIEAYFEWVKTQR
jgi:hypothetical protein